MNKKRVIKREIADRHIRFRNKRNTVKVKTNITFTDTNEVEDTVEELPILKEAEPIKPKKTKKHKTEESETTEVENIEENNE